MKALVVLLALVAGSFAQAGESQGSISCLGPATAADRFSIQFEARLLLISSKADGKTTATVWEPIATVVTDNYTDEKTTQIGRKNYLEADANYKPRKYKGTVRFDLSNLVDTNEFGSFLPDDQCSIKVMIPTNIVEAGKGKAAAIINCDQSGFSKTLECTSKPRQN